MIPGISSDVVDKSLGHTREKEGTEEETVQESKPKFSETVKLLPGVLRVVWFFLQLPEQAGKVIPYSVELIEDIRHKNLCTMTLEELDNLAWQMYDRNSQVAQVHAVTTTAAMSLFSFLQKMVARYGEEGTENLLTTGLEGMSSCQLGIEMWKLAESASRSPRISALIHSRKDVVDDLNRFSQGRAFLEDLDNFADRFGDRCSEEMELSIPRWGENPNFVLSMVANYLNSGANPVETMEEQKKMRLEATDHILRTLSRNPVEKLFFEKILEKTQQYIVTRENLKTTWMRGISAMRVIYLAIADNLVKKGILKERDDIFYLKVTEVSDIIAETLKKEQIVNILEERRKEKEEYEHLDIPEVIVGKPPPIEELIYTVEPETQFEGTGCSCGVITGKARVVMNPAECPELKEGEILVAPYTDPGWSPLFVTAGGLVTEIGGTLSHGVIIAREYGIPAVVGVKNATRIIKTGQLITVDGTKGMVYIRE
jgi:pyruvate,water dikinase